MCSGGCWNAVPRRRRRRGATLHAVSYDVVGLGEFGRPDGHLARQVRRWRDQWGTRRHRELPDMDRLYERLQAVLPVESGAAVVRGDLLIDNVLLDPGDPGQVRAPVDREMAPLADPLAEPTLHLVYRDAVFELVTHSPIDRFGLAPGSERRPAPGWALHPLYAAQLTYFRLDPADRLAELLRTAGAPEPVIAEALDQPGRTAGDDCAGPAGS
ncbi:phosphotransferase [Streptomyces sp. NPDC059262]|uniref:phosphotransferase n=1 Tax=Streptomyces sp. NPDC059262 TaxID=3346797 RepID=UPI0036A15A9C